MGRIISKIIRWIAVILILVVAFYYGRQFVMQRLYPLAYQDTIKQEAEAYNADPYLVAAIIWAESSFNAEAESSSGARGLMQIMPDTGEWIAGKIEMDTFSPNDLFNPEVNITLGCWYLHYLSNRFDSDVIIILAAYNAGPNRVAEWLDNEEYGTDGKLNAIPYPETEEYIKRVQHAYEIYQTYYTLKTD